MGHAMSHLSKLTHYRILPEIAGWPALIIAFAARAPFAMVPLGVLTAVTSSFGSVAVGGLATAVTSLAAAIAGPLIGKWADRVGQQVPLRTLIPLNALALTMLFTAIYLGWPLPVMLVLGACAGATSLPIGSFTRQRWVWLTSSQYQLAAALSYESMADEFVFVLGPALVGVVASLFSPLAPLFIAALLTMTVGVAFAFSPVPHAPASKATNAQSTKTGVKLLPVLATIVPTLLVMLAIGVLFGSTQAALTERARLAGAAGLAGLVYSAMGVGSALMAIFTVLIPERISLPQRLVVAGFGVSLLAFATASLSGLPVTALLLFTIGLFVGPGMVTAFTLSERLAPAQGMTMAMTALQSAVTIGVSFGALVAGWLAQSHGEALAFRCSAVTGIIIALVGFYLFKSSFKENG